MSPYRRSLGIWLFISVVVLAFMLLHRSDDPRFLGRYSTSYAASLAVMLGFVLVAGGAFRWADRLPSLPHSRGFTAALVAVGLVGLALFWRFFGSWNVPAPALFRCYIAGVILVGLVLQVRRTAGEAASLPRWVYGAAMGLVLVSALGLTALYLGQVPPSRFFDEPWEINRSWTIYRTHSFGTFMYPLYPQAQNAIVSGLRSIAGYWMGLIGPGLEQARLFYLLVGGWLALPFLYLTARKLYGATAGLCALAIATFLPLMHTYARPDGTVAAAVAAALYCFFTARENGSRLRHYLTGLLAAAAFEGHPYGLAFTAAFGLVYLFEYGRRGLKEGRWSPDAALVSFIGGGITYGLFFAATRLLVIPGGLSNIGQIAERYQSETLISGRAGDTPVTRLINVNLEYYGGYFAIASPEVVMLVLGMAAAFFRRRTSDWYLLTIALLAFGLLLFLITHNAPYYFLFYMPFVALFGGALLAQISGELDARRVRWAGLMAAAAAGVLFIAHTVLVTSNAAEQSAEDFRQVGRAVAQLVPPDVTIAGWQAYYLGMPERERFVATENFYYDYLGTPDQWGVPKPEAVILTRGLDDNQPRIYNYLQEMKLRPAYCFPMREYGGEAVLYLPTVPANDGCKE